MSKNLSNRDIKANRVKNVFIETTLNMIISDGVNNVSSRKVADESGYTFATIYNHFDGGMDQLLFETRTKVISEIIEFLKKSTQENQSENALKVIFKSYIDYFIKTPNLFEFVFFKKLKTIHDGFEKNSEYMILAGIFTSAFTSFSGDEEQIQNKANIIFLGVHGMLMIYMSESFGVSKQNLYDYLEDMIKLLNT